MTPLDGDARVRPLTGVRVLVVDDLEQNRKLMHAVLEPRGFVVRSEASGQAALEALAECEVDVVLLDVLMPVMDGYETCERIKADPRTAMLPVVMVTASGTQQRLRALEVGADDFVTKPFDQAELVARVRSLARVKRLHDTVLEQTVALERWNAELETRVAEQVDDLDRLGRLRRFLSPQIAGLIVESGDESFLESHRRDITTVFTDLRGFTAFAETAEPEETMSVLREYHGALGELVFAYEGTLEHFAGDGLMVFFNDPPPCPDAPERAVRMALDMRDRVDDLASGWSRQGHQLGFGVGIAQGYATLGRVGFEGRWDYAAIGTVTNVAARLCAAAAARQILISPRVRAGIDERFETRSLGPVELRGISRPLEVHEVIGTTDREDDP
ncbi:guanylate cyclase [Terrabacter sp. Root85]|uniref:adenylate/guanylate cyclase domain-containing response regulator n=1 Tax=unclassified Terrabacter TaxID=2630222 RepID=UPI0006FEF81A|nr:MULTISPECIES: adenylate/guanylate cyclase domain-containing response regulator [unclassified Terrabacter]KRC92127.1 guanylate cyclase [Terrabacter sp. Root85]KRF48814.1 guanylate cyclase [Terrabacter sp. Soil811]